MHNVPKIVKHSYRPLLKIAKSYKPDAIYVERQRPNDTLSLKNYESSWFIPYGDSIATIFKNDVKRTLRLQDLSVHSMKSDDFKYLKQYYATIRDKANWYYYAYLYKYGIKGSKKPVRNENGDLTAKLAITMNLNYIHAMDYQHETQQYTKLSKACIKQSQEDDQVRYLKKRNKRDYQSAILPALFGRLGFYTNKQKTIKNYEISNRFTFRKTDCTPCIEAAAVWDRRNAGMAKNIGEQVLQHNHQNSIVIVGAGHVLGIKKELEKQYPSITVKIMDEISIKKKNIKTNSINHRKKSQKNP
ncbi:DUF5694 domain-containing protein [Aquimarina sp. 2201CG14-23]|uniref:DUF5694 domain-containing protein n=1 Tax=Aquimarina mycalae TaxID=3040073 RepID=UPI0024782935|nr:DUF5694 domain-containing protein [Aquimarina sp. 2201CG14-23]MDH7444100.1 DUF5694 domain-containing protein [Aquimarina sp. 2201CG14-23]